MSKVIAIRGREDGGGIECESAGCVKCDKQISMVDDIHHSDGSVCVVMARNMTVQGRGKLEPLGRYDPRRDFSGK